MGMNMIKDRWVRHGVPDIENPMVERTSGIVFKGDDRGVRSKKPDRIEMVRENGDLLRA